MRRGIGVLLVEALPPPDASRSAPEAALARLDGDLGARITVLAPDGRLLGSLGEVLPEPGEPPFGWRGGRSNAFVLPLPDGRLVLYGPKRDSPYAILIVFLVVLAGLVRAVGMGAWPLARRLARRLQCLQGRVEALGAGDLAVRAEVEGRDEVAALARSFNRAAERVQAFVELQRGTLAAASGAASGEMLSPLARIRRAVTLPAEYGDPALRARVERDAGYLKGLIGEILLASRLGDLERPAQLERVDFQALSAEEAARLGAEFAGAPATLEGEGWLLARLLRNLLENAARRAPDSRTLVELERRADRILLRVSDRGPDVSEEERERMFEPFHRPADRPDSEGDRRGVGLGLSLVRRIAHRHGGGAACLPRAGGGARFEVSLPAQKTRQWCR